jgi:hypothetical protein
LKKAFIIVRKNAISDWSDIALNYTQLSIDYSVTSRLDSAPHEYYIENDTTELESKYSDYDELVVINEGTILLYGMYERFFSNTPDHKRIKICDTAFIIKPKSSYNVVDNSLSRDDILYIDAKTFDKFKLSHINVTKNLIDDSNMTYFMHNEIPVLNKSVVTPLSWAVTVSSGFFINQVLDYYNFTNDCKVCHVDISKISLMVREYTIKNWDGYNVYEWINHIHEKYPSIKLFNKGKLTSKDPSFTRIWDKHIEYFGEDKWIDHWNKYKKLNHSYHRINMSDINDVKKVLSGVSKDKHGAIWWNGSLKRISANLMRSCHDSHSYVTEFLQTIQDHNPNTICFGSDHCNLQFDGINITDALTSVSNANSRNELWIDRT